MLGGGVYKGATSYMQGGIRQFRMYRRELSQLELLQNASNKCLNITNQAALLANIPLSEGTGNTAIDLSANFTASVSSGSLGWGNYFPPYYPTHTLPTVYEYNSLNQVMAQASPDGNISRFWYDALGRLVASRNEEQLNPKNTTSNASVNRYSYTVYDAQGRITEVGEKHGGNILKFGDGFGLGVNTKNPGSLELWYSSGSDHQVTQTYYDVPASGVVTNTDITIPQALNSRKRVVSSIYKEAKANTDYDVGTHYVYDLNGNVKTLFQEHKSFLQLLPTPSQTPRRIDYEYDLISGKVNKVHFQKDKNDRFSHKYEYDAENRLTAVWTSKDEHGFTWENDARYYYYLHGPLARSEIGDHEVQGLDYAYTLQGWLKGINGQTLDPSKDMGEDGLLSNPVYKNFSRDVMAFSLGYHNNDYKPIGNATATAFGLTFTAPTGLVGTSENTGYELFNGNIRNTTLALNKLNGGATSGYSYLYDQLNRLTATKQHNVSGTTWSFSCFNEAYRERTTYDANGNIMRYLRQGANVSGMPLDMDSLTYNYYAGSNKLSFVRDAIAAGNYTGDVDMDNQSSANYDYDKIGNLMSDVQGGLSNISWNVYGKIRSITKTNGTTIHYKYDPSGNRIEKSVTSGGVTTRDFYIRDAQGNILSVYRYAGGTLKLEEMHLFGSSRLGLTELKRTVEEETIPLYPVHDSSLIGWKRYELGNHLGNVLAVISDKKTGVAGSGSSIDHYTAEVISEQEYYPFGMGMPGRSFNPSASKHGFNGQEKSTEIDAGGNSYTAEFWQYDARLGRRWNVDPRPTVGVSDYASFKNNPILFSDPLGDTLKVTTKSGAFLFNLNDGNKKVSQLTAKQLYDRGTQWFEPLADNYMPIIDMNKKILEMSELKHFSWRDIDKFSSKDRWMLSYRQGGAGDWKSEGNPGDGYLMVTVGGKPYWADAVGQIPFALNYFKDRLGKHGNESKAITETIEKGREYGEGKLVGGKIDKSNSYDIYFVLRGALYAAHKYQAIENRKSFEVTQGPSVFIPDSLGDRIWYKDAMPFLGLKPAK